jgi:hypothetical protein
LFLLTVLTPIVASENKTTNLNLCSVVVEAVVVGFSFSPVSKKEKERQRNKKVSYKLDLILLFTSIISNFICVKEKICIFHRCAIVHEFRIIHVYC